MLSVYICMHIVLICWGVLTKHLENHTLIAHGSGGWGVQDKVQQQIYCLMKIHSLLQRWYRTNGLHRVCFTMKTLTLVT